MEEQTGPPAPTPCPQCTTPTHWDEAWCPQCGALVHLWRVGPDELDELTREEYEQWTQSVLGRDFYGRPYEQQPAQSNE